MAYPNPPANPQLDLTHGLAATLQSLVLFDGADDLPRNLVNNSIPRVWAGTGGANFGETPAYSTTWTGDATSPTKCLRFGVNSRSLAWPNAGICGTQVRSGNPTDLTYFAMFAVDAIDRSIESAIGIYPIVCNSGAVYGDKGNDGQPFDGMAAICYGGGANDVYLGWVNPNEGGVRPVRSVTAPYCRLKPGHQYLAAISFGTNSRAMTMFLYDLTTGTLESVVGSQDFDGGFGPRTDSTYSNWIAASVYSYATDMVVAASAGSVIRVRLAGLDNRLWAQADFDSWRTNPYACLTATRVKSGSPPTSLIQTDGGIVPAGGHTWSPVGSSLVVAGATASGTPALPVVFAGDWAATRITHTAITFTATPPLGSANEITSYKLYASTTATPDLTGSPVATSAARSFTYTPPDGSFRIYQLTATDSAGTVYTYPVRTSVIRSRAIVRAIAAGNSITSPTGSYQQAILAAGAVASANDCALAFSTQGVDGQTSNEWIAAGTRFFFGPNGADGNLCNNPLDWLLTRAQAEFQVTGAKLDGVVLQLAGNSPGTSAAQYAQIANAILSGTGIQGTYTPAVKVVYLALPPAQQGGQPLNYNLAFITTAVAAIHAAAATSPDTIKVTGTNAQRLSVAVPDAITNSHPNPFLARAEGAEFASDLLGLGVATTTTIAGPGGASLDEITTLLDGRLNDQLNAIEAATLNANVTLFGGVAGSVQKFLADYDPTAAALAKADYVMSTAAATKLAMATGSVASVADKTGFSLSQATIDAINIGASDPLTAASFKVILQNIMAEPGVNLLDLFCYVLASTSGNITGTTPGTGTGSRTAMSPATVGHPAQPRVSCDLVGGAKQNVTLLPIVRT